MRIYVIPATCTAPSMRIYVIPATRTAPSMRIYVVPATRTAPSMRIYVVPAKLALTIHLTPAPLECLLDASGPPLDFSILDGCLELLLKVIFLY